MIHFSLDNNLLRQWHELAAAFHLIDDRITFQRLQGFSGNRWYEELSDEIHLTLETQWDY